MNYEIQQIAERLRTFRESLDETSEHFASLCEMSSEEYNQLESGNCDIPVGALNRISTYYQIDLSTLMFGDESHMQSYFVTRAGTGPAIERSAAYRYEGLAVGFKDRKTSPFIVTIVSHEDQEVYLNHHEGQEFNYIIEGVVAFHIKGKVITLYPGDSIYFDARLAHGLQSLHGESAKLLAMII